MSWTSIVAEWGARQLAKVLAVAVFAMAAGPGLCAIACEAGGCNSGPKAEPKRSCCKEDSSKPSPCCERMAKVSAADGEKAHRAPIAWIELTALPTAPVLPEQTETAVVRAVVHAHNDRAPPGLDPDPHLARGPPGSCE